MLMPAAVLFTLNCEIGLDGTLHSRGRFALQEISRYLRIGRSGGGQTPQQESDLPGLAELSTVVRNYGDVFVTLPQGI